MPKGRGSSGRSQKGRRNTNRFKRKEDERRRLQQARAHSRQAADEYRRQFRPQWNPRVTLTTWVGDKHASVEAIAAGLTAHPMARNETGMTAPAMARGQLTEDPRSGLPFVCTRAYRYAIMFGESFISDGEYLVSVKWENEELAVYQEGHVVGTPVDIPWWVRQSAHLIELHANEAVSRAKEIASGMGLMASDAEKQLQLLLDQADIREHNHG